MITAVFLAIPHHALTIALAWEGQGTLVFVVFGRFTIYSFKNWEEEIQRKHTFISCSLPDFHVIKKPRVSCRMWEG